MVSWDTYISGLFGIGHRQPARDLLRRPIGLQLGLHFDPQTPAPGKLGHLGSLGSATCHRRDVWGGNGHRVELANGEAAPHPSHWPELAKVAAVSISWPAPGT
jgi:hypothetical protein